MRCFYSMVAAAAVATILGLTSVHANGATQSRTAAQHLDSMVLQQLTGRPDSIPVETIVPVLGPDYTSVDTITQPRPCPPDATRAERRACRAERFALGIDSLVGTRSIAFYPTTMQAEPRGMLRMIYPAYFYVYVSPADVEVHMPVERGVSQYVTMLNFDADGVRGYSAKKVLSQWVITFSVGTPGDSYDFVMVISTVTGETVLQIRSSQVAMRYVGSVGERARERYDNRPLPPLQ